MLQDITEKKVWDVIAIAEMFETPGGEIITIPSAEADQVVDDLLEHGSPRHIALITILNKLSIKEFQELCAIMWLGRGDDESVTFEQLKERASVQNRDYVASKSLLGKYLRAGLVKLNAIIE